MTPPRRSPGVVHAALVVLVCAVSLSACAGARSSSSAGAGGSGGSGSSTPAAASSSGSGSGSGSASGSSSPTPPPDPTAGAPRAGRCSSMTARQSVASVVDPATTRCRAPHTTVVAAVRYPRTVQTAATPLAQRRVVARRLCEPAYRQVVGGTAADRATSILTWTMFVPPETQLQRGARWVRCEVLARSGGRLVQLPAARPLLGRGIPEALRVCETAAGSDVSCSQPHTYRVAGVFEAAGRSYPGASAAAARDRCHEIVGGYGGSVQYPSRAGWRQGDRYVRCLSGTGG